MQESDAIHLVCYMVLEYSGACVLYGTNKFWNYRDSTSFITKFLEISNKFNPRNNSMHYPH